MEPSKDILELLNDRVVIRVMRRNGYLAFSHRGLPTWLPSRGNIIVALHLVNKVAGNEGEALAEDKSMCGSKTLNNCELCYCSGYSGDGAEEHSLTLEGKTLALDGRVGNVWLVARIE